MKKRLLSTLLAFCMMLALLPGTAGAADSAGASGTCQIKFDGAYDYDSAYAIFDSLNSYRRANGCSELVMDGDMLATAMQRAAETAIFYSHTRPDGSACYTIFPSKFTNSTRRENIAVGYSSADAVMTGWKNSSGHNDNMLAADNRAVGIGAFVDSNGMRYWVQVFASGQGTAEASRATGQRTVTANVTASAENLNLHASPSSVSLQVGESAILTVRNTNAGYGSSTPDIYLTYAESQTPDIAAVSIRNDGKAIVTAVGNGQATLKLGVSSTGTTAFKTIDVPVTVKAAATVKQLTKDMFVVDTDSETYNGSPKTKRILGNDGNLTLAEGKDYTVTYVDNTRAGTASIIIMGKELYSGTLTYSFTIHKADRALTAAMEPARLYTEGSTGTLYLTDNATADLHSYTYSSSDPSVATVKDGTVTPVSAGTATITVYAPATDNYQAGFATVDLTVSTGSGCTVTFDANGGTLTGGTTRTTDENGRLDSLPAPTRAGYTFTGWFTNRSGGTEVTVNTTFNADTTVFAHWSDSARTITFDANGGILTGGTTKATDDNGRLGSLPTPTRAGYAFTGWFTNRSGGTEVTVNTIFNTDTTVFAHWSDSAHTITFDANGGTLTGGTTMATDDNGRLNSLPTPTRTGYTFTGWFTNRSGGTEITTDAIFLADTTVFAHWSDSARTITFDANGGILTGGTTKATDDNGRLGSLPTPTRTGYTFAGWFTDRSGGTEVTANTTFIVDTTVFAHWTESDCTITVKASPAIGGNVTGGGTYAKGRSVTVQATSVNGYRFIGWMENGLQVSSGTTYTFIVTESRTLSAQFERIGASTPSATPVQPVSVSPTNDKLEVDGWPRSPAAYKINDYNYFKLRDIAALLNGTGRQFSVGYDTSTGDVTLTSGQPYSVTANDLAGLPAGSRQATASTNVIYINGVRMQLTAYLIDGYNYFKLRDLASALDFYVGWTAERGMFLESGRPYSA